MQIRHGTILFILLLSGFSPVQAEIHRCTDADGSVSFSDTPCGESATTLKPYKPSTGNTTQRNEQRDRLLRAFDEERRIEREQRAEADAERAKRERKCAHARDNLRMMREAGALYDVDKDGNRQYLSQAERVKAEQDAQAAVKHWCDK